LITKNISDSFTTFCRDRSDSGQAYTFYHSMLVMPYMLFHYTDYPRLLFFWTKVRSKSQPNTPVKTYMEYPDDDLIFEISEYAPPGFPNEYAKLFQPIRTDLKVYEPYLYKNTGDKKYFRNFIVDPVAWKEWIVPCCAHIDNCLKRLAGNQSGQSSSENNTSSQDESDNKKENVIAEIVAGMKGINKALFEFTNNSGEGFPDVIFDIEYSIEPEKETVDNLHDLLDSYQKQHKNIINYFNVTAPGSCFCSAHIDFGEADEKNLKDVIRIIHNSDNRIKKIRIE
ncbi:MAG: hypothetical protein J5563_08645, partial [Clostridia bacterium]|nr:hypothetical protein [Clostridia bacterium]